MSMKITTFAPFDDGLERREALHPKGSKDSCDGKLEDTNFE